METLIEQLIIDFHDKKLPELTRRHARIPWVSGKADTIIGMRRSGKTWFLYQVMGDLLSQGIPKEAILYLNFEDERLLPLTASGLQTILDIYFRLYPALRDGQCNFFFDEIQEVSGWEKFARRVMDTENIHFCFTGSSSRMLSREIATSLRGRTMTTEIFPFSFRETLHHFGVSVPFDKRPTSSQKSLLENKIKTYLEEGGFPEVQSLAPQDRVAIHQNYVDVVIFRDVVERHKIGSTLPLRTLIRHLLNNSAALFSVNKFYNTLKSQGIACGKNSLYEYLDYLEDAYLFFRVQIHTCSERIRQVNPVKVYCIDPGLCHSCSHNPKEGLGFRLETFVFLELRKTGVKLEYYKTSKGYEVDFLVANLNGSQSLIQVSLDLNDPKTRKRELRALSSGMSELGLKHGTIVTLYQEESVSDEKGEIQIVPAWLWALSL